MLQKTHEQITIQNGEAIGTSRVVVVQCFSRRQKQTGSLSIRFSIIMKA